MRHLDEYRDPALVHAYAGRIRAVARQQWAIMEVCGGQTHSIVKNGLEELLPQNVRIVHGPGCPVCVTPIGMIDCAVQLASRKDVIFASFGDMLRVPGSRADLLTVKARNGDVRAVYSPLDALRLAADNPGREVVFFAVGFETTAPANAMLIREAARRKLANLSLLCSQVLVPPALKALLADPECAIDGVLAAGHVCAVTGYEQYRSIASAFRTPVVVTGFEPVDIMHGMLRVITMLEHDDCGVENAYGRVVRPEGNRIARRHIDEVFSVTDKEWRGIGVLPMSGLRIREEFATFDAMKKFNLQETAPISNNDCIAGEVLQGRKRPAECMAFGGTCIPEHPLGAPMVSSEGACAAYYLYSKSAPRKLAPRQGRTT